MGDGLRTVRVVTSDESLLASARASAEALEGWEVAQLASHDELLENPPAIGDVLLIDAWLSGRNVYELCRGLAGRTKCRTWIVVEYANELAGPIARFCGATGVLSRPITPTALREALATGAEPEPASIERRGEPHEPSTDALPEALLADIATGDKDKDLIRAVIDPVTGLFNYAFLNFKLDEEFKRAQRFDQPLACVMLGFEGQAGDDVLRELCGIFLMSSRDTDVLGRFDETSFLFLLPNTGPDGARIMAHRVAETAAERGLRDLVGDPLAIAVGISSCPHPEITQREELYAAARGAFLEARREGGGVVVGCA